MAAYLLNIKRVNPDFRQSVGCVRREATTKALMNADLARSPDNVSVVVTAATEAQLRGIIQYAKAVSDGVDTSSVETAVGAILS